MHSIMRYSLHYNRDGCGTVETSTLITGLGNDLAAARRLAEEKLVLQFGQFCVGWIFEGKGDGFLSLVAEVVPFVRKPETHGGVF